MMRPPKVRNNPRLNERAFLLIFGAGKNIKISLIESISFFSPVFFFHFFFLLIEVNLSKNLSSLHHNAIYTFIRTVPRVFTQLLSIPKRMWELRGRPEPRNYKRCNNTRKMVIYAG